MPRTGLWLRVFVGLLLAVLPPILMVVGALLLTDSVLRDADPDLVAIMVVVGAIAWAALLAIVYTRSLADDFRALLDIARSGGSGENRDAGSAYQQLASSLDERNRQVASLATQAAAIPIDDEPRRVAGAIASAVRTVMRDPTWRLGVLTSQDDVLLPPAVYHATDDDPPVEAVGEIERWASVTADGPVSHVEGPWGAFVVVDVAVSERLRSILLAPWEGRLAPTAAERDLLSLVGQNAGTALEHSLLYARVRSQADELTRLAAVQADFLRGVTHDLQTPLTSIGALATELRAADDLSDAARTDLDSIAHQAERLRRMVSQLLIASRLEAGAFTPQQEVFAVAPLVERTWSALRADRPFDLSVEGPAHLAVADPDRLEQVLWALLDNAVKYSPPGSPITVRIAPADGSLAITVADHGTGMDEKTRSRAFDQFYRSAQARKLAPDGSGVGLYAAQGLMVAMGGSISISSALGTGAAITARVPAELSVADE